jgi:two-component system sensor histidine kinase CiaH
MTTWPTSFDRHTLRLAATHLAIIMVMSFGFSYVFYHTTSAQLSRQLPPHENSREQDYYGFEPGSNLDDFLQTRVREGKHELLLRLLALNMVTLCIGAGVSLLLARRSLEPIEEVMNAQTRFVSDASHELRTPLTALQTTNEVVLRRPKITDTAARAILTDNVAELIRLKELTDALLGLIKNEPLTQDIVHLNDVLEQAVKQSRPLAKLKNIKLVVPSTNLEVRGSDQGLTQVLTILLDNAIKYSNDDAQVNVLLAQKAKKIQLQIKDEGIGIAPTDRDKIFDRFYRSDAARNRSNQGGFGLGLSIARAIVQAHGGSLNVASELGKGSTFTVEIPLLANTPDPEQPRI